MIDGLSGTGVIQRKALNSALARGAEMPGHIGVKALDEVSIAKSASLAAGRIEPVSNVTGLREAAALLQVADAGLVGINGTLDEMKALAKVVTTTITSAFERAVLDSDFLKLMGEIDEIAKSTEFNGEKPLAGDGEGNAFTQSYGFGASGETFDIELPSLLLTDFAPDLAQANLLTYENALKAEANIDQTQAKIDAVRDLIDRYQTEISVLLLGGEGESLALDMIHGFGEGADGADLARDISQTVVLQSMYGSDGGADQIPASVAKTPGDEPPPVADQETQTTAANENLPPVASLETDEKKFAHLFAGRTLLDPESVRELSSPSPAEFEAYEQMLANLPPGVTFTGYWDYQPLTSPTVVEAYRQVAEKIIIATQDAGGDPNKLVRVKLDAMTDLVSLSDWGDAAYFDRAEFDVHFQEIRGELEGLLDGKVADPSLGLADDNIATVDAARAALVNLQQAIASL